jgi:hypothetical protein
MKTRFALMWLAVVLTACGSVTEGGGLLGAGLLGYEYYAYTPKVCEQNGPPPIGTPNHNGDAPDFWCCIVKTSAGQFVSEGPRFWDPPPAPIVGRTNLDIQGDCTVYDPFGTPPIP